MMMMMYEYYDYVWLKSVPFHPLIDVRTLLPFVSALALRDQDMHVKQLDNNQILCVVANAGVTDALFFIVVPGRVRVCFLCCDNFIHNLKS